MQPANANYSVKTKPIMKIMQLDGEVCTSSHYENLPMQ